MDERYFKPIRQAQTTAILQPWWDRAIVFRLIAKALNDQSFCLIDNFLPEHAAESLHKSVHEGKSGMLRGPHVSSDPKLKVDRVLETTTRGDLIKFCEDSCLLPGCAE